MVGRVLVDVVLQEVASGEGEALVAGDQSSEALVAPHQTPQKKRVVSKKAEVTRCATEPVVEDVNVTKTGIESFFSEKPLSCLHCISSLERIFELTLHLSRQSKSAESAVRVIRHGRCFAHN